MPQYLNLIHKKPILKNLFSLIDLYTKIIKFTAVFAIMHLYSFVAAKMSLCVQFIFIFIYL